MIYDNLCIGMLENDLHPFILFDNNGKIKDFNKEAEFLFNYVKPKELYELAVSYASLSFGFKNKYLVLKYGKLNFYAITVGYINDVEIGLRLYKEVCQKDKITINENIELTNIFSLIELSKTTTLLQSNIQINEIYDVSIPEIKLNINEFLLILNKCFETFKNNSTLELKVYVKIGEYSKINDKKYQIISIDFKSLENIKINKDLKLQIVNTNIDLFVENDILKLEFPMIF